VLALGKLVQVYAAVRRTDGRTPDGGLAQRNNAALRAGWILWWNGRAFKRGLIE